MASLDGIFCDFHGIMHGCICSLQRLLGESGVALHSCKEEGRVHPVEVKCCDDSFPSQPENMIMVN